MSGRPMYLIFWRIFFSLEKSFQEQNLAVDNLISHFHYTDNPLCDELVSDKHDGNFK